eukprot:TRINITY_DN1190_c0_g1_i1.p1 TRINITY_DN1190_c0_g1~~TRINITY_DN1190_c0_g1_i1.p1  ORF type:complete len:354 (+),score=106.32 TRINITY_DN1190_c0_g1_i1:26-1087(+)
MSNSILSQFDFESQLSVHTWSPDRKKLVISFNDDLIRVYDVVHDNETIDFQLSTTLKVHLGRITSLDWCPVSNRLASSSDDHSVNVWQYDEEKNDFFRFRVSSDARRSVNQIKFTEDGNYLLFVTSRGRIGQLQYNADKTVSSYHSTTKQPHKSCVNCFCEQNNGSVFISGGTDSNIIVSNRVLTDEGERYKKVSARNVGSWVNSLCCCGSFVIGALQASSLYAWNLETDECSTLLMDHLPITKLLPLNDEYFIGVGFDCEPFLYRMNGSLIEEVRSLDKKESKKKKIGSGIGKAIHRFQRESELGVGASEMDFSKKTLYQLPISDVKRYNDKTISTIGFDGKLVLWNIEELE